MEFDQATLHNIQEQATKELTTRRNTQPRFLKYMFKSHMLYEFQSQSEGFLKIVSGLNTVGASAVDSVHVLKTYVYFRLRVLSDWFYF